MMKEEKVIVVIIPEVLEREGVYDFIRREGYKIAVVAPEYRGEKADYHIKVDNKNLDAVVSELVRFNNTHKIEMIYTASEFGIEIAAAASEILGIKFASSYAAVKRARNKYLTRRFLEKANIATPHFELARNRSEIINNAIKIGFPVVVKPLNAAGSCSVMQINTLDELEKKVDYALEHRGQMPVNDHRKDTTEDYWIVEEYLDGIEISVECCTFDSKTTVVAIHDKYCDVCEPYFIEKTFVTPPFRFSAEKINEIEKMAKDILKAIGYDYGISHIEMKITSKGPKLIEVNARLGGGLVLESVIRSTGINLLEVLFNIRLGREPDLRIDVRDNTAFTMIPVEEGKVIKIEGFEEARKVSFIDLAVPFLEENEIVKARQANYGGFILAKGNNFNNLLDALDTAEKKIHFTVEKELV